MLSSVAFSGPFSRYICKLVVIATETSKISKRKAGIEAAFAELQRQRESKRMMASKKEINDARGHRGHYAKKIKTFVKSFDDEQEFSEMSLAELQEAKENITRLLELFDEKCLHLGSVDAQSGTAAEDEQIEAMCSKLKGKLAKRMAETALPLSKPPLTVAPEQEPVLQQAKNNVATANSPVTTETSQNRNDIASGSTIVPPNFTFGQFKGGLGDWHRFAKRFKTEVKSDDKLNESRKLELLLNACDDVTKTTLAATNDDFESTWNYLESAFGESYAQYHFCLSKILETQQQTSPSADGIKYIRTRGNKCMEILSEHSRESEMETTLVVYLATKLDSETSRAWDRRRADLARIWAANGKNKSLPHMHIPTWKEFSDFLQGELDIFTKQQIRESAKNLASSRNVVAGFPQDVRQTPLIAQGNVANIQVIAPRIASSGATTRSSNVMHRASASGHGNAPRLQSIVSPETMTHQKAQASPEKQCRLCPGIHMIYHCDAYQGMSFDDKWRFISEADVCVRCFFPLHGATLCKDPKNNKACKYCWGLSSVLDYHNGTLCPTKFRSVAFPVAQRQPPPPMPQSQPNVPGQYR